MGCFMSSPDKKVYVTEGEGKGFSYATASCQGWRREQEDAEDCLPNFDDNASLFVLCDGHGGSEVAKYTVKHFPDFLKKHPLYIEAKYEDALENAFIEFDAHLRTDDVMEELRKLALEVKEVSTSASKETETLDEPQASSSSMQGGDNPEPGSSSNTINVTKEAILEQVLQRYFPPDDSSEDDSDFDADNSSDDDGDDEDDDNGGEGSAKRHRRKHKRPARGPSGSSSEEDNLDVDDEDDDSSDNIDDSDEEEADEDDEDEDEEEDEDDEDEDEEQLIDEARVRGLPPLQREHKAGYDSGCTVVVALVKDGKIYVASAGDSRCILINRDGTYKPLSYDHKPENLTEVKRIVKAGGIVTEGRVNGGLNLSRAFGDFSYKKKDLDAREQMITPCPTVKTADLDPKDVEYIFLACDGIWNSMSNTMTTKFILKIAPTVNHNLVEICVQLFRNCIAPDTDGDGTGCDNMTCIIARYTDPSAENTEASDLILKKKEEDKEQVDEAIASTACKRSINEGDSNDEHPSKRRCIEL